MKGWIAVEARFEQIPPDWSPFADAFTRFGCPSSLQGDAPPSITGYLEEVAGSEAIADSLKIELTRLGAVGVDISRQPDEDWSEIWKKHFKPRRIGRSFVVVPSWETFEAAEGDILLFLDPGQAFGTGEHPTTELCLKLLEKTEVQGQSVLDLGCGSGILAIAAAKLGAEPVAGADIETSAVEIARKNAELNSVEIEFHAGDGFEAWSEGRTWNLVLSNIISATLIRLAPEMAQSVAPGGSWIVSGILQSNWADVLANAERCGFALVEKLDQDDWVGASLRRSG